MRMVLVGVQKADRDRLDALRAERGDGSEDIVLDEAFDHGTARVDTLVHAESQIPRDQRRWGRVLVVVQPLADAATHLQRVPEPERRDQAGAGAAPGENGVGRHGGAVDDHLDAVVELGPGDRQPVGQVVEPGAHVRRGVVTDVRYLRGDHRPVLGNTDQVGEGTADIHADVEDVGHARVSDVVGAAASTSELRLTSSWAG